MYTKLHREVRFHHLQFNNYLSRLNEMRSTHSNYCDMMFEINDRNFAIPCEAICHCLQQPTAASTANLGSQTVTLIQASIRVEISTY